MPKIFVYKGYLFLIFGSDINESRRHIHITSERSKISTVAKVWLQPEISVVKTGNFSTKEINDILEIIRKNETLIHEALDNFFAGKKVKFVKLK